MRLQLKLCVADSSHASLLSKHIQRAVAAYGVQPLRQVAVDLSRFLVAELQESVLDDLSRLLYVTGDVGGVSG
jgi:hypothetical protein